MGKIHTTISIDEEVLKQAKEKFDNFSGEVESAIKKRMGGTTTTIPDEEIIKCSKCGVVVPKCAASDFPQATGADSGHTLNELPQCMMWDGLGEDWICVKCSNKAIRRVVVAL